MRRLIAVFLLCLLPLLAAAEVPVPALTARVTDLTGTLSAEQQAALENKLAAFEAQKGSQIAVLIVPTTQPEAIEQYAIRVVDQWKLGRKDVDDGVLLLLAKDDRQARIEVGYGLEGVLPDVIAKRIIENLMIPQFRQGNYYAGIDAGIDSIIKVVQGEPLPEPAQQHASAGKSSWEGMLPLLLFGGLIAGGILRAVFGSFLGGAATGGLIGAATWILGGGLIIALVLGIVAFVLTMSGGLGFLPIGGGGFGRSSGGGFGGGFSGGGGGFGGGGASGGW